MRAVVVERPGGPEVMRLEEVPVPGLRAGEVLIRVVAAGVNRPDLLQRQGAYPPPPGAHPGLGLEVAGEVVTVAEGVSSVAPGAVVCALTNGGGYAEYCAVPAGQCLPVPAGYDGVRAAALPENAFTVWTNLFDQGRLAKGETLLVHGGSSGIGTIAIQFGRLAGARVLATAGTPAKCDACRRLGAERAIDYRQEDFVAAVHEATGGRGADCILDMVGGAYLARNVRALAPRGRLVVIAVQGGSRDPDFDLVPVMRRRLTVTGSTLRPRSIKEKAAIAAALHAHAWPWFESGAAAPVIDRVFPLHQVAEAHRHLEAGGHVGKVVLRVAA